jgi:macrolide transport system ATP-binding/permease protein
MVSRLRSFAAALLRRNRFEDAMADEVRFHMDAYADDLVQSGMSRAEAERRALVEFGGTERVKEECRQARGLQWVDELRQDTRYAIRSMAKTPGFTTAAVISIALGIGANTAIFTLMDALLLRPMPVREPHQLYFLGHDPGERFNMSANYPMYERYRDANLDVFSGVTAYMTYSQEFRVGTPDGDETVDGQYASGNYHALLGVPFVLGRGFTSEPDRTDAPGLIAVISDSYWARRFGRRPDVLGRTLTFRGRVVTIIGVTAPEFYSLEPGLRVDVTLPMSVRALDEPGYFDYHNGFNSLRIVGRVREGVSDTRALAAVDTVFHQFMSEPEQRWVYEGSSKNFQAAGLLPAARGSDDLRRQYARPLNVLMAMVGVVLLIACANVANLLLARAASRTREVAVRMGVGACRARLVRQFLTESLLLAFAGGALGLLLAFPATAAILSLFNAGPITVLLDVSPNRTVLAFTTLASIATGVAFGLVPALRATRVDLTPALKDNGAGFSSGRQWTTGKVLVASQLALCVIVIAAAGLLVRTLQNLKTLDAGFHKENILLFNVDTTASGFAAAQRPAFFAGLVERLRARPGVVSVSLSRRSPIDFSAEVRRIDVPGFQSKTIIGVSTNVVTPEYFSTFGIGIVRGRAFTAQDHATAPKVALVSEAMARVFYGEADPIGRSFLLGGGNQRAQWTIVGVVQDVRQERLRTGAPTRMVYTPLAQGARGLDERSDTLSRLTVEIRMSGDATALSALAASARDEARALHKAAVVSWVRTMDEQLDAALIRERVLATLSTAFGALALILSSVGLYGVMAYTVARRSREIGIKLALGAARSSVLLQVLRDTVMVSAAGIAIGIFGAVALAESVSAFLFGLAPRDPLTLAGSAAVLLATTLVAGYLPARKAAAVDPMQALRAE